MVIDVAGFPVKDRCGYMSAGIHEGPASTIYGVTAAASKINDGIKYLRATGVLPKGPDRMKPITRVPRYTQYTHTRA
jgi:hypothetical protein